ncbi:CAP domain-containing protein [Paenibacillus sp. p3-SID1389]|uniref:CAP domain-containing protein n=1 Tax=Paenibacillus sp. p3-SID1389 TaxID=2916364 RepID=UPI0021A60444|nr:CAP domain-containing protein [Paenibacillus sp. p3-SID1389]MCT2195895.1 CAP domain-containing protein [Paenibacillus sp. p3-SID1389]
MKSNRLKRLVTGGLTAMLAAAIVVPASASAASNTTTNKTYTTYKVYTTYGTNTNTWTNYFTIPWYLYYPTKPVQSGNQGTTGGQTQTGNTQGTTQGTTHGTTQGTTGNTQSAVTDKSQFATEVIQLVNQERAKQGLKPLTGDAELNKMALAKAKDMSDNNYFSHTSPTYGSPFDMMKKFGIQFSYAGENIAMGQKTPAEVVKAWMNSEGHRANILNANYNLIGVGYYNGYWAQEFVGR